MPVIKSRRRARCPFCGQWMTFGQQIMLSYAHREWGHIACVLLDIKQRKEAPPE